tara:strand:- start:334 stop:1200 length:867 start_codon:yes stop_codon:yes gene_type:complete
MGIYFAIMSALCWAALDAQRKRLSQDLAALAGVAYLSLGSAILFSCGLAFVPLEGLTSFAFWKATLASAVLNLFANLLFFRAVQLSPLSLTVPYLSFTPVFLLLTGFLWLGEVPSWIAGAGAFVILLGAMLLNPGVGGGRFATLKALTKERGSLYMLIVAFLWSNSGPFDKMALQHGSIWLLSTAINLVIGVSVLFVMWYRGRLKELGGLKQCWPVCFTACVTMFIASWTQLLAIEEILVAYVDTIKRSGVIFVVLIGYFFFHERPLGPRLLGASVMVFGAVLVILGR